jgi:hypothetical protein
LFVTFTHILGTLPQYGFKAGLSDAAFPSNWFAIVLRALCCHRLFPALCQGGCAYKHLRASGHAALPQGPSLRSGLFCPGPSTLNRPHPPHSRAHPDFTVSAYTRCLRCTYSHRSRQPTTGSELSLMLFRNMSSSETTGNFSAACTQHFTENTAFNWREKFRHSHHSSHSDSGEESVFEALLRFAFATTCCFASPPVGADRIYIQPSRTFTPGLPTVWSPSPSPGITTVPTGQSALAGLSPARPSIELRCTPSRFPCQPLLPRPRFPLIIV